MKLARRTVSRLTTLINFMEALPPEAEQHFDMGNWFVHYGSHEPKLGKRKKLLKASLWDCGSKACALGWAAAIPSFRKSGLVIIGEAYGGVNFVTAQGFFGLSAKQAQEIFGCSAHSLLRRARTPKEWAKMARELLNEWRQQ